MGSTHCLVTFMGMGRYEPVHYQLGTDGPVKSRFVVEPLIAWTKPDRVCVLLTAEARSHTNWDDLRALLECQYPELPVEPWDVPSGKSEGELWELFQILVERLGEGDRVSLDVTHGFRSLPVLVVLAGAYLRVARRIHLCGIYYGAYEAKAGDPPTAPVFDLSQFLDLLDWAHATDLFQRTGDCSMLGQQLSEIQNRLQRQPGLDKEARRGLPQKFKSVAQAFETISASLATTRLRDLAEEAAALPSKLTQAAEESRTWARAFTPLVPRLSETFAPFVAVNQDLEAQLRLAEHLAAHDRPVQAAELMRERLVSMGCRLQKMDEMDMDARDQVERMLSEAGCRRIERKRRGSEFPEDSDADGPLTDLWNELTTLRNDLAHCGMRKQPLSAGDAIQRVNDLLARFRTLEGDALAQGWHQRAPDDPRVEPG